MPGDGYFIGDTVRTKARTDVKTPKYKLNLRRWCSDWTTGWTARGSIPDRDKRLSSPDRLWYTPLLCGYRCPFLGGKAAGEWYWTQLHIAQSYTATPPFMPAWRRRRQPYTFGQIHQNSVAHILYIYCLRSPTPKM